MSIELKAFGVAAFAGVFVVASTFCVAKFAAPARQSDPTSLIAPTNLPPLTNAELADQVTQGGKYFQESCARCHGSDAYGHGEAPSLVDEDMSDGEILTEIYYGKGRMPSFSKKYSTLQIQQLTRFIRSLKD